MQQKKVPTRRRILPHRKSDQKRRRLVVGGARRLSRFDRIVMCVLTILPQNSAMLPTIPTHEWNGYSKRALTNCDVYAMSNGIFLSGPGDRPNDVWRWFYLRMGDE